MWLVRHGPTDTPPKCCLGWSDVDVSDLDATRRRLDGYADRLSGVQRLFSSDLRRARQTADVLADLLSLDTVESELLRELNFGDWELSTFGEVAEQDPANYQRVMGNWLDEAAPGGESLGDLLERVEAFWSEPPDFGGDEWAIVAHRGTCSAIAGFLLGSAPDETFERGLDHAAACRIDLRDRSFEWNIGA